MFGKLKEKLKGWVKSISKSAAPLGVPQSTELGGKEETEEVVKEKEKSVKKSKSEKVKEIKIPERRAVRKEAEKSVQDVDYEEEEEEKPKQGFFSKILSKVNNVKISEEMFDVYAEEMEMLLLENNVALEVAEKIIKELKEKIVGQEFLKKEIEFQIGETLKDILRDILVDGFLIKDRVKEKEDKPYVILFCGVNGTGKTTTIAKIANSLQKSKVSCVIAAADTFRAASIEQIKIHGEKLGVRVVSHEYGADPASVGFDAIKYAKKNHIDCVLIDTAGRMHSAKNLVQELEKISRVCKPDLKVFVGEAITGNDAIEQVKTFNFAIGIDGIVLSKADIDEKGGTALSVGYVTKKPILYLGTGQEYDDIEPFDKNKFIDRLGL